ncbi:AlgJ [mine drainage metagenome]|uniref:AlgJ n=1 Tax=mine drainage metagenome TaxID=410659 RepID=T1AD93_9ZZZZ
MFLLSMATLPLFQGCSEHRSTNLIISAWGPHTTQVGVAFNTQPNGDAAFWVDTNQKLSSNATIVFNSVKLKSAVTRKLVTALVPADLYAKKGTYPLYVVNTVKGNQEKSNTVDFIVTPK